jgi:diguanylate cyclase (GGDEF)-like protein
MLGVVTSFKDITERQHAQAELQARNRDLESLVALDVLTQLANRRHFEEVLNTEWLRAAREKSALAVIMCNVDNFQRYNDHHGQAAGDNVIKQVAAAIRGQARRPADVVARYSDADFGVILPGTPVEGAVHVAERIRTSVEKLAIAHQGHGLVTLSLGVAGDRPAHATVPATMVQHASQALARAKQDGRNRSRVGGKDESTT